MNILQRFNCTSFYLTKQELYLYQSQSRFLTLLLATMGQKRGEVKGSCNLMLKLKLNSVLVLLIAMGDVKWKHTRWLHCNFNNNNNNNNNNSNNNNTNNNLSYYTGDIYQHYTMLILTRCSVNKIYNNIILNYISKMLKTAKIRLLKTLNLRTTKN